MPALERQFYDQLPAGFKDPVALIQRCDEVDIQMFEHCQGDDLIKFAIFPGPGQHVEIVHHVDLWPVFYAVMVDSVRYQAITAANI